jgi:hypothetical protein
MISIELNVALNQHLLDTFGPGVLDGVFPLSAYDDTKAPFILFFEDQGTLNEEQWFMRVSNIIYYIYDNDISRMKDISHTIDKFLNVGDNVQAITSKIEPPSVNYGEQRYRLVTCRKVAGSMFPPAEREGFATQMSNFRVVYLDQDV